MAIAKYRIEEITEVMRPGAFILAPKPQGEIVLGSLGQVLSTKNDATIKAGRRRKGEAPVSR